MAYIKDVLDSQKDLRLISREKDKIITKAKYGPSKPTQIPLKLSEDLSFFIASIIGDGHLKKDKFQISIELSDKLLLNKLNKICKDLFGREFNIHPIKLRNNKKPTSAIYMDSKQIYNLLNKVFEIPVGKKSHIVKVPIYILNSNRKIKIAFLKGIMATEGGRRKRGFGLSTASKNLWEGLIKLFNDVGIAVLKDKWVYKKYKKMYYGISFKEKYIPLLTWVCRSGQTGDV